MKKIYPMKRKASIYNQSTKIFKYSEYAGFMCRSCYNYIIARVDIKTELKYKIISGDFDLHALGIVPQFNYQCPNCGTTTCYEYRPIDPNIVHIISLLNKKGFETAFSCEGHDDEDGTYSYPYVSFKHISHKAVLDYIPLLGDWEIVCYNKIVNSDLSWGIHIDKVTYDTKKNMDDLYQWANLLPWLDLDTKVFSPDMITDEIKQQVEEVVNNYSSNDEEDHEDFLDLKLRNY